MPSTVPFATTSLFGSGEHVRSVDSMMAEAESLLSPASRTHTRAPSSTSTAEIVETPSPCCCQGYCQQPSTSATATLRSNASDSWSIYSCNNASSARQCCHSCDHHLNNAYSESVVAESFSFLPASSFSNTVGDTGNSANAYASEDEDSVLRYSFKGIPPELYSAKKEFIYRRPLVEKQVSQSLPRLRNSFCIDLNPTPSL